jgi:hypothetical protein
MTTPRLKRLFLIPDAHHPFVKRSSWKLVLKVAKDFRPDILVTLGDFIDCWSVSNYDKSPARSSQLQTEIDAANLALDELDNLKVPRKEYLFGNHEARLEKYLSTRAPELFSMMKIEQLLKLEKRGWGFTKYKDYLKIGKLFLVHDTGSAGMYAHIRSMAAFEGSVVQGHTHRLGSHYIGSARGNSHVGISSGWIGDPDQVDYAFRIQSARDWHQGFTVGYMEPGGNVHLQLVPIVDNACVVSGKRYSVTG